MFNMCCHILFISFATSWDAVWRMAKATMQALQMQKYSLQQHFMNQEHVAFSLVSEAVAVKERKHIPPVGASVDRRALQSA
eukprot:7687296-Karenia_brevis.AAC.1